VVFSENGNISPHTVRTTLANQAKADSECGYRWYAETPKVAGGYPARWRVGPRPRRATNIETARVAAALWLDAIRGEFAIG